MTFHRMATQELIDGLKAGADSIESLASTVAAQLQGLADLGASAEHKQLQTGFTRLHELKLSLVNLYTILEIDGVPGLWKSERSKPSTTGGK